MDPGPQAFLIVLASVAMVFAILRFIVPLFPGDGREAERLAQRERQEREAASKAAE